jgi:aminoglycoside phosphotransferase (APT) family kinase protein
MVPPENLLESEEAKLAAFIERLLGGRVTSIARQPRWRKAWFVELQQADQAMALYVRGDKQLDAEPYPGLEREANILRLLEAGGIRVPHVHGYCPDPIGIVMDRVAGERDVARAASDTERRRIAEQSIAALAAMHRLDIAPFVAMGITRPKDAREAILMYLEANQPLYARTKRAPEPFIEFALRWARRNVPEHAVRPSFIHCDAGQFLFDAGELRCLYDFEASHIGDPLADLAALRLRDPFEPLGAPVDELLRRYCEITGTVIDPRALSYHTAIFALTAVMTLAGPLRDPDTALQAEYLVWDLTTRRGALWAMAECMGTTVRPRPAPPAVASRNAVVNRVLDQTIRRLTPQSPLERHQRDSALTLSDWLQCIDARGPVLAEEEMVRVAAILGHRPANWLEADALLEKLVLQAGPERDRESFEFFALQLENQVLLAEPVRARLAGYALRPVRL